MKLINENLFEQYRNMRTQIEDPNIHASGKWISSDETQEPPNVILLKVVSQLEDNRSSHVFKFFIL